MLLCVDPPGSAAQKEEAEILFSALTNSSRKGDCPSSACQMQSPPPPLRGASTLSMGQQLPERPAHCVSLINSQETEKASIIILL